MRCEMTLRVVGAGVGRTATMSLKHALERLLGEPCYHMFEVLEHPDHIPAWHGATFGDMPDWHELFDGFAAAVDWPASAFWPELSEAFPEAVVLLSVRDPHEWWRSADETIFPGVRAEAPTDPPHMVQWHEMVREMMRSRFTEAIDDPVAAMRAFERHNDLVRETVPADRLVEWQPGDGWGPICAALDVPVPDEPFPHRNSTEEFRQRVAAQDDETDRPGDPSLPLGR